MIYQNDKGLNTYIKSSGCYYLSLLFISQIENQKVLTAEEINNIYKISLSRGVIDYECTILNPNELFRYVSPNITISQVGSIIDDKITYWGYVKNKRYDWKILKYKTFGRFGTHFIVSDNFGNVIYDPLKGVGYTIKKIEKFILYRIGD